MTEAIEQRDERNGQNGASPPTHPGRSLGTIRLLTLLIAVASLAFLGGVLFANAIDSPHNDRDFSVFWQSWDILEDEYYYPLPEDKELVYGAIRGLMSVSSDRYTFFVPPRQAQYDRQTIAGEFGGIGAHVTQGQDGQLIIVAPFRDMPAEQAGLLPDDIIQAIDGVSIEGWPLEDAVALLRGEIGSSVEILVYRPADDSQFSVDLVRTRVELPTVYSRMYDDVGYVRLFSFNQNATAVLTEEISGLFEQNPIALVLDLRTNPGGLLDQAVSVSDLFLGNGIVVTQHDRKNDTIEYRSTDGDLAESIPLVVLIDGGSASASEVVAGALHDRERAILIGQTTFGKGSVQHIHDLSDGSQLHVTFALWFTPNNTPIQDAGLPPDIEVTIPDEQSGDEDPFIKAALDYVDAHIRTFDTPDEE